MASLIVLAGLPGTGKSTIACALAQRMGTIWLRIDSIERAIREANVVPGSLDDAGYRAAYAIAEDNLKLGRDVIGDSVNLWMVTRNAWRDAGLKSGAKVFEVETICTNLDIHRRRVETQASEIPGLKLPEWAAVRERDYHPWDRDHLTIDTATVDVEACVHLVLEALKGR
jgi:predicted kinase